MNEERAIAIVQEMIDLGYNLMGKTAREFAKQYGYCINFLETMLALAKKRKENK